MISTKLNRSKFFSFLISIIILLNLTSCEGFFTDNNLDQKIRAAIDYANAPSSSFWIAADATAGTINPIGKISYKPTDYQNIKFKLKPEYQFIRWNFRYEEIQSSEKYQKEITNQNWWKDYIEIVNEEISEPSSNGEITYSLQIKFIKAEENMLIEPICAKKPAVDEWKPNDDKAGVPAQTEIVITFDSEISENSFIYNQEELSQIAELEIPQTDYLKNDAGKVYGYKYRNNTIYKSIKIYVEGSDYTGSFSAPSIETIDSGSKKYSRLTLTPTEVLPCPEDETKTAIVSIELENTIVTKENVKITPVKYQYRINSKPLDYSYVDMSGYNLEEGQPNPNTSSFKYAVGKNISLSFKENSAYQFLHWETNNENILFAENDVSLNPTYFYSMNLIRENEKAAIVPVCIARPKFNDIVFKNKYSGKLNPRDEDIVLTFDKAVSIPKDAVITITCTGKGDVTSSFEAPVINGNTIQITAKKDSSRINVNPGEKFVVTVNIPDTLYYVYHDEVTNKDINVTIGNTIKEQPSYEIDSTTQNKAALTFRNKADDDAPVMGTLTIDNEKKEDKTGASYDIDKQLALKFKPNEDYTFLYWTCSNTNVEIKDRFADSTELTVKGAGACSIIPKCAPKLKILSMSTEGNTAKPCDSDIWLETNIKPEDFTSDGRNGNSMTCISVSYNGLDVLGSSYKVPEVKTKDGKTYIYLESINKLSVPHGTTGSVIVKIDGTLYYNYTDADNILSEPQKIEIANGGYSRTFTVSEDTSKKIYVKINSSHVNLDRSALNDFKNNSDIYVLNEKTEYDLTFTTNDTYQFVKWNVQGTNTTPVSIVETDVYGKKYYTLKIAKVPSGVEYNNSSFITVSDDCATKLAIISCTPQNKTAGVERDSNIEITFNQRPADDIKEKISIKCDGDSVLDSFNLAGATFDVDNSNRPVLIIPANLNKRINVSSDKTKTVKIIVSSDAYYLRSGETEPKITLGTDFQYEYIINHNTNEKAKVLYKVYSNSSLSNDAGTIKCNDAAVTINSNNTVDYNMDLTANTLTFIENPGYQFLYWATSDANSIKFDTKTAVTNKAIQFNVTAPSSSVTVSAYCAPRPVVSSVSPFNADPSTKFAKNTPITITFAQPIKNETKDAILISYTGVNNISKTTYFNTTISSDNKTVTLTPIKMLPVTNDYETVTVTIPHNKVYYLTNNGSAQVLLDAEEDFTWSYRVKDSTMEQSVVSFNTNAAYCSQIKINNKTVNSGDSQILNEEDSIEMEYPLQTGYKFEGWKINAASSSYTVTSSANSQSGYVTSGTITVGKNSKTYFTITIDDSNPTKATLISNAAIDKGAGNYSLEVLVKDYLQPLATITPDFTSIGVDCDTDIQISFNKAVSVKAGITQPILGSNGIIRIVNEANKNLHYEDYFNSPVWSTDRKTLTISPKYTIRDIFSNQSDLKTLIIQINYSCLVDDEGYSLESTENIDCVYRIKYVKDEDPPYAKKLFIARSEEDALNGLNLAILDEFEHYAAKANYNDDSSVVDTNIKKNHVGGKVWINYEFEDLKIGIESVEIQEQLIYSVNGQPTTGKIYNRQTNPSTNYFTNSTNADSISGILEYDFNELQDGVVRLSFIMKDKLGNSNIQNVDLIKDTIITIEPVVSVGNDVQELVTTGDSESMIYNFSIFGIKTYSQNSSFSSFITDIDGVSHKESFFTNDSSDFSSACKVLEFQWWYDGEEKHYIDVQSIQGEIVSRRSGGSSAPVDLGYVKRIPVSITVDPRKNVNYTCTYCDSVGNTAIGTTKTVFVPIEIKAVQFTDEGLKLLFDQKTVNSYYYYCYIVYENEQSIKTEFMEAKKYYGNGSSSGISSNKLESDFLNACSHTNATDPRRASSATMNLYTNISEIGNGKYYLYLFKNENGTTTNNERTILFAGKPFVVYKTDEGFTTNSSSATPTVSDIPSFTATYTNAGQNTSKLNVHIDWDNSFSYNNDYTYFISDGTNYFTSADFQIKCEPAVKLKAVVYDKNMNKIEGAFQSYAVPRSQDSIPPEITVNEPYVYQNYIKINGTLSDSIAGLKTVNSSKIMIKAFLSDTPDLQNLIDWNNNPDVLEVEYYPEVKNSYGTVLRSGYFNVPIYGIVPKYVYYYVEDDIGNYKSTSKSIPTFTNLNTVTQVDVSDGKIMLSMEAEKNGYSLAMNLYAYYIKQNSWEEFIDSSTNWNYLAISTDGTKKALNLSGDAATTFIKIEPQISAWYGPAGNYKYAQDSYFYVPYLLAKDTANPIVCNLKDIISGQLGVTVLADQPYFVHTLYCPRNLGSNLDDWLNIGMETGIVMKDTTFTYSYENANDVPSGYYYTIIVHFADGTKAMSDVRQK